jgi:hypothetical protein
MKRFRQKNEETVMLIEKRKKKKKQATKKTNTFLFCFVEINFFSVQKNQQKSKNGGLRNFNHI